MPMNDEETGPNPSVAPSNEPGEGSVTVVGTAHVSEASVTEVEETIEAEQPDVVAVELDESRYRQMKGETPDDLDPGDLLGGNTVFQFLAYWILSYVQSRLGDRFDIDPGAELLAAVETAEAAGIGVALVDREIRTTIQRFWARLTILEKFRMVGGLAFGVTDPRVAGVTLGIVVGLLLGPVLAVFGGTIGVTTAILTQVATGAVVGGVVGYLVFEVGRLTDRDGLVIGLGGGALVGTAVAVTGVGAETLAGFLSTFFLRLVGSLALGLVVGIGVGVVVGLIVEATGIGLAGETEEAEFEEFDPAELTDTDVVSAMMEEFRAFSPGGAEALIDERDAYIATQLVELREAGYDVVAVVGAGHRAGIESYLDAPETLPPFESLTGTISGSGRVPWGKIVGFGITAVFVGFFVLLAMAGVRNTALLQLFGAWFLINAVFAVTLARLAGARWLSAAVGGAVAWLTSINPLLAPGWFTGYMELRHLTVNVTDIATLNELLSDESRPLGAVVSDMLDVPLFRLIVVVAATNIGSVIASVLFATYVLPAFGAQLDGSITDLMVRGAENSAELIWGAIS